MSVLFDLLVSARLLRPELVAWEGEDFETSRCVLCIDCLQELVVAAGEPTLGGNIDNKSELLAFENITQSLYLLAVNVGAWHIIQALELSEGLLNVVELLERVRQVGFGGSRLVLLDVFRFGTHFQHL